MIMNVVRMSWAGVRHDRVVLLLGYLVPLAFFSVYAGVAVLSRGGAQPVAGVSSRVLGVVDADRSDLSRRLVALLRAEPGLVVREDAADTADAGVRDGAVGAVVAIPKGFEAAPLGFLPGGAPARLELAVGGADPLAFAVYGGVLQQAALALAPEVISAGGPQSVEGWTGGLTPAQRRQVDARFGAGAPGSPAASGLSGVLARQPVAVAVRVVPQPAPPDPTIAFYAAAMGVMTLLFTAAGAATSLIEESETGILARVLSSRVSLLQLLGGKLVFTTAFCLSQLAAIFVWAAVLFRLDLVPHLLGWLLVSVPTASAAAAFSLAVAALCRTRARMLALSGLIVLAMGALGGSMFPRFLMPEVLRALGLVTFNAWALDGFTKVFWQQVPSAMLWPQVSALVGFTAAFFLVALRFARRWDMA